MECVVLRQESCLHLITLIFFFLNCVTSESRTEKISLAQPTVFLVSFDGFRWDYLDRPGVATPNFDSIVQNGVKAKYLINTFVTKTYPNHFTLVTGLFEETHGIVGNYFYDPFFNESFYIGQTDLESKWWKGEPVWITNQKANMKSAVVFWPGSEVKIEGQRPSRFLPYNRSLPFKKRVDYLVSQLEQDEPPSFLALYFNEPDHTGHRYGPDSPEVSNGIRMADNTTGYLLDSLRSKGLLDQVNLIITSDHGMAEVNKSNIIFLDEYLQPDWYRLIGPRRSHNPVDSYFHILPKEGFTEKVYAKLKEAHKHLNVFKKEDIPDEFHYKHNRRVMPIFVVADEGWVIAKKSSHYKPVRGQHGYSNKFKNMYPFFIAQGPAFKKNFISEPFQSVDVYPLMCHILGITPAPNNGSLQSVQQLLQTASEQKQNFTLLIVISVISLLTFIFMSYGIVSFCVHNHCKLRRYGHIYDLGTDLDL